MALRRKFWLAVLITAGGSGFAQAGTVTYAFDDISAPLEAPGSSSPQSFFRTGTQPGYFYTTMGSAYLTAGGMTVSSWTRVQLDISAFSLDSIESATLRLRVRDGVGPEGLTVWTGDSTSTAPLASTSRTGGVQLQQGINTVDLTSLLQTQLAAGRNGLGLWFYNYYTPQLPLAVFATLDTGSDEGSTGAFIVSSKAPAIAAPTPDAAIAGLALLTTLGAGQWLLSMMRPKNRDHAAI